ncbi:hypothetical protein RN001_003381 [Aquatica leii]|uniref:Uncharacterized protein n=1 Tax=Aquatica leii TaxID=1421715 RepID=A0AAN7PEY5_9COLE|nr:hypothetical protein RN001_003381 [Aquatica leii]
MAQEVNLRMYLVLSVLVNLYFCHATQDIWHSYQFDRSFAREELLITDVITDNTFKLNKDVVAWKSISTNGKVYGVGLLKNSVVILNAKLTPDSKSFEITEKVTEFSWNLTAFEIFEHWNLQTKESEIILILSTSNVDAPELYWYKIIGNDLEPLWTWHVHKNVTHMRFLQFDDDKYRLLILKDAVSDNFNLYEFELTPSKEFWLSQTLSLSLPANSSAVNFYGSNFYLSIPQKEQNEVRVYKLEDNHFKLYQIIRSNNVVHVNAFKIGFKSFLAISGEEGGIYKFTKDYIESQDIQEFSLENVDFWLPVPIKTYRDEVALILQRSISHGGHSSFTLDVIVYDGQLFHKLDEIPCNYFGELVHGLDCMVDEEGHHGINGAAVLSLKDVLGVLVPHKGNTFLYMIHSILKSVKSPIELEIEKLMNTRDQLQKMIEKQVQQETAKKPIKTKEKTPTESANTHNASSKVIHEDVVSVIPVQDELQIDIKEITDRVDKIGLLLNETEEMFSTILLPTANNHFDSLTLSGLLQVQGKTEVNNLNVTTINKEGVEDVFKDVVRKHHLNKISGQKVFKNVEVKNISFETINGIEASEIVFNTDDPIIINGNIFFEEFVNISDHINALESINNLDLINEIVEMSKTYTEPLEFEHIKIKKNLNTVIANNVSILNSSADIVGAQNPNVDFYDTDVIEMFGNISVENINGVNFDIFKKSVYFTNTETYLPEEIFINGEIHVLDSADVQFLNDLKFPEDYVLRNHKYVTISGEKYFENPVFVNQLIIENSINGVKPNTILTLSTNQSMPGRYIFDDFEATETLNVEGDILGPYVDKLIPNPSLLESDTINAKVVMNELEVDGCVTVANNYNNQNLQILLQDVVYKNELVVNITAIKNFTKGISVLNGITSLSAAINSIPISSFVTTDTDQELLLKTLNGPVTFENLLLQGVYGGINVTKLEEETVKLSGDQFVAAELVFINNQDDVIDLSATEMEILSTINGFSLNDYFYKSGSYIELSALELNKIKAKNVVVEGNVVGEINGFSIDHFDSRRLSSTREQQVTARYTVKNLHSNNFNAKTVNGETFEKLFSYRYYVSKISEEIFSGAIKINKLFVNGSVFMDNLNGINVTDMLKNYLWSNQNNYFNVGVFETNVFVGQLNLKYFNGIEFNVLFNNVVYKNQPTTIINGFKTFTNGLHISKMLNSEHLNGIYVDHILTKTGQQRIEGPLTIVGNVVVNYKCEIYETFNGVLLSYLSKTYEFIDDTIIINDDLVFNRLPYINNLIVVGYLNGRNLNEFFQDVVYKNHRSKIFGNTTFVNNVQVNHNLIVLNNINGVDFSDFVQDMVLITNDDLIGGKVMFTENVYVHDELMVDMNLDTKYLNDIDLDRWKNNAVFVNRGVIPGKLMFDYVTVEGSVYLNYINDIEVNSLIPLRTDQYINKTLELSEITSFHNISVKGQVSGYNLLDEFKNTVLMSKPFLEINSDIVFENNVMVHDDLEILGLINGKNLSNVVTVNTEQHLTSDYEFNSEVTVESNIEVNGLINNINITEWLETSVKTFSDKTQIISDNWTMTGQIVFEENVVGSGNIHELDIHKLADALEEKRVMKISSESGIMEDYTNICKDVNAIISIAKNQIFVFKYLEYLETFTFINNIENVHHFKAGEQDYMLITEVNACASHLLSWSEENFHEIGIVETGSTSQIITVFDGSLVFLVSRSNVYVRGCKYSGTNVWKFEQGDLIPLYKLEDHKLLQESLVPGTFYAMSKDFVIEYHILTRKETNVKIYRKWKIDTDNLVFVPRGLGTGLALSSGVKIFKLLRKDVKNEENYGYETDAYIRGEIVTEENGFLPGYKDGDMVVLNVGYTNEKRSLAGVALHEETSVKGKFDFIKIYEDVMDGKLFHKVPTYKPSSLISVEFANNGETLLIFLEDKTVLQVYEYKGIEGFKHRFSVNMPGSKLITMTLPIQKNNINQYVIGIVNNRKLTLMYAVMSGNQMHSDKLKCK